MKINKKLLLTCALAITSNSFGMLTSKSFRIKKMRSFCTKTSSHDHPLIFKKDDLNISTKDNRALLHEIIEQNKENNKLLRTIIKQNYIQSYRLLNGARSLFDDLQYEAAKRKKRFYKTNKDEIDTEPVSFEDLIPFAYDWQLPLIKYTEETNIFVESLKKE